MLEFYPFCIQFETWGCSSETLHYIDVSMCRTFCNVIFMTLETAVASSHDYKQRGWKFMRETRRQWVNDGVGATI